MAFHEIGKNLLSDLMVEYRGVPFLSYAEKIDKRLALYLTVNQFESILLRARRPKRLLLSKYRASDSGLFDKFNTNSLFVTLPYWIKGWNVNRFAFGGNGITSLW